MKILKSEMHSIETVLYVCRNSEIQMGIEALSNYLAFIRAE